MSSKYRFALLSTVDLIPVYRGISSILNTGMKNSKPAIEASWGWHRVIISISIYFQALQHHCTTLQIKAFVLCGMILVNYVAFTTLKNALIHASILKYPDFSSISKQFRMLVIQVLRLCLNNMAMLLLIPVGHSKSYSIIQKECVVVVHSLKQFHHCLLGKKFFIITDHAPLQWLSTQKMEGLPARWAFAKQEYDFTIIFLLYAQRISISKGWTTEMKMHFFGRNTRNLNALPQLLNFLFFQNT